MELEVWKQPKRLVKHLYELTKKFPKDEQFGLTSQLRRAAVSIPSNIAEGCGRNHYKDSIQFFFISRGGLYEIETQIIIASDLGYIEASEKESILNEIKSCKRLLNGFINYFQNLSDENAQLYLIQFRITFLIRLTTNNLKSDIDQRNRGRVWKH